MTQKVITRQTSTDPETGVVTETFQTSEIQDDVPVFVDATAALAIERGLMVASAMQVRLALLAAGRLAEVEAIIAAADQTTQIAWDTAVNFKRNSPTIAALAPLASPAFSDTDLDNLFRAAMVIEV